MEKLNCKGKLVTKQEKKKEIEVMSKQMKPNTQVNKKKGARETYGRFKSKPLLPV